MTLLIQPWWMYINFEFRIQQKFHMTEWLIFIPIFACNSKYFSSERKFINSDIMNFHLKCISKLFLIYLVPKSLYIRNFWFACEPLTLYLTKNMKNTQNLYGLSKKNISHSHTLQHKNWIYIWSRMSPRSGSFWWWGRS